MSYVSLKREKLVKSQETKLKHGEVMKETEKEGYILELLTLDKEINMKETFQKIFLRRPRLALLLKLNGRNKIKAINT